MKKKYRNPILTVVKIQPSNLLQAVSGFDEVLDNTGGNGTNALGREANFSDWDDEVLVIE